MSVLYWGSCISLVLTSKFYFLLRKGEHKLPNSVVYLFIPGENCEQFFSKKQLSIYAVNLITFCIVLEGLFSNHGPLYFVNTKLSFSKMGLACHIAKIHSEVDLIIVELISFCII